MSLTLPKRLPSYEKLPQNKKILIDEFLPFITAALSGCTATMIIQPIDLLKVQIQIKNEMRAKFSIKGIISEVIRTKGYRGFYIGLDSALMRQITYGTTRLGGYRTLFVYFKSKNNGEISFSQKILSSLTAGFLGSLVGNPFDLALVRMQADSSLPEKERRKYRNVFDALKQIIKKEGVLTLWRGSQPTILRAMAMNIGQLAPYDEIKERLNKYQNIKHDNMMNRLIASACAGFSASVLALPFDNTKTKIQKMKIDANGIFPYSGVFDCIFKTIRNEGILGLWAGLPVFYFRVAPHAMITLIMIELLRDIIRHYRGGKRIAGKLPNEN